MTKGLSDDAHNGVHATQSFAVPYDVLKRMPKVELHCHLDGSLRAETMLDIARTQGITLPHTDADSLRSYMCADGVASLAEYLTRFETTIAVLQTEEALERAAYELVEDVSHENVRYLEVRNAPRLNTRTGLSLDDVMQATLRGLARGEAEFGTVARFIVCSLRHWSPEVSLELAQFAVRYKDQGVVAFDLAGGEAGNPAAAHAGAFAYARRHFLNVTCHAGEAAGAESIEEALHVCGANRIGHGVRAAEHPALLDYLIDRQIPLELCPTSNVQTNAVSSYSTHPLRDYLDRGAAVTVNTDNRLISGTTLTAEFSHLITQCGLTIDDLSECVENACRSAFLPLADRIALFETVSDELESFRLSIDEEM
jgi:adenosine deaminase